MALKLTERRVDAFALGLRLWRSAWWWSRQWHIATYKLKKWWYET